MTQAYTAADLATRIGATLVGDPALELSGIAPLDRAGPHDVAFFAKGRFAEHLKVSEAGAVIVADPAAAPDKVQFVCSDPYLGLRGVILAFHRTTPEVLPGIAPGACVDDSATVDATAQVDSGAVIDAHATIGAGAYVGALCYVGRESVIGPDSYLYPRVTLYHGVKVGQRVILHAGVVIGADGFGYARNAGGALKIPQIGGVEISDDVEVGANTTIDRGTLSNTKVGKGTKIDNLVMIAHNVEIGEHCLIVAQSGIAGSTRLGNGVIVAAQAGVVGHIEIGEGATIGAQSGVSNDVPAGKTYLGSPARDVGEQKRIFAYISRLPDWVRRLRDLEKALTDGRADRPPLP